MHKQSFIHHPFSPPVFLSFSKRVDKKPIRILSRQLVMRRRRRRSNVFVCLFVCVFLLTAMREKKRPESTQRTTPQQREKKWERRGIYRRRSQPLFSFTQLIDLSNPTTQMHYNTLTLRSRLSISSIAVPGKDLPSSLGNKRFFSLPSSFLFSKPTAAIRYLPTSNGLRAEENLNRSKGQKQKEEILPFNCKTNSKPAPNNPPVSQLFNVSFTGCKFWPVWMCPELNRTGHTMGWV